jgi:uncharacterized protein (UPF0297 family)
MKILHSVKFLDDKLWRGFDKSGKQISSGYIENGQPKYFNRDDQKCVEIKGLDPQGILEDVSSEIK